ncbi:MAG: tetratricopeptide repeat protein [Pyrinomonadaceae bacterium]|nr:tetratricopeptide repeat protein [Pyrinomonadaceae bacterium]
MKSLCKISLLPAFVFLGFSFAFAQTEREKGIKLYQEGKNKEAVAVLEKASRQTKDDAEIWNALGLAYIKEDALKKAIKAFEKAVNLNPQDATYYTNLAYTYLLAGKLDKAQEESGKAIKINPKIALAYYVRGAANVYEGDNSEAIGDADKAISINPDYSAAYVLKSDALLYQFGNRVGGGSKPIDEIDLLQRAKDTLEICLKNCRNNSQVELQKERLDTLTVFHDYFSKNRDAVLNAIAENPSAAPIVQPPPDPSVTPMKILAKPHPTYTDKARQDLISGKITLAVLFSESGQITHTLVLKGLGGGLNANAVKAAYGIKFEPAKKDGKPFSQIRIITYSFTILSR